MSNKKICGIYKITNTLTNEAYIGQSKNIEKRIATHKEDLENGTHVNKGLQEDYDLAKSLDSDYEIFTFEIIKEAKSKNLNKEEMYWINEFNSFERGYNRTIGGSHDETQGHVDYGGGRLFTDEKRIKLITKELTNDFDNKENYIFKTTSNEVLCSKCGKEFNDEFEFCPYCGSEKPKLKICPKCKLEPSIEFSFCPKCGTELIEKEKYLRQIEWKKKYKEQENIEKEWKKGQEICNLIEKGDDRLNLGEFRKAFEYYNEATELFDSINRETYNQVSPMNDYFYKEYDLNFLNEEIIGFEKTLKKINKIYDYENILESDEWNFKNEELYELLINYFKTLSSLDEGVLYGVFTENEYKKLYNILNKATILYPNEFIYWKEKGILLYNHYNNYEAIDCYKNALEINPKDKEIHILLIKGLMYSKCNEALKYCENILKLYPSDVELVKLKLEVLKQIEYGFLLNKTDKENILERKLECYDKLLELNVKDIEIDGEDEKIWKMRLEILIYFNKYEEIIECCDKVLAINYYCNSEKYWEIKINALSELERFEEAIECQKTAIEYLETLKDNTNTSEKIKSWQMLLKYPNKKLIKYQSEKLKEKQLEEYDELIKKEPNNKSHYLRKTALLRDLSRYKEADKTYSKYEELLEKDGTIKAKRTWKTCNNCGHKINSVAKKCPYCEYEFKDSNTEIYSNNKKICPKCKNQVDSNFKICPKCFHVFHE